MNKWQNYGLWTSLASTALLVLQTFEVGIDVGKYNALVNAILGTLAVAGIISNPNDGKWFNDNSK